MVRTFLRELLIILASSIALYAAMLGIGVFLNTVAPPRYKDQIQRFFENPAWRLNAAVQAFVGNTFHRVFGKRILSRRFFLFSIIFSLFGFGIFTLLYFALNTDPICKYPVDWCDGFRVDLARETLLLLTAMIAIDVLSFAQTSMLIQYALRSARSYELIFIAYADIVLTLAIFCFVLPLFLTLNQIMIPESGTKTDVFAQLSPASRREELHEQIQKFNALRDPDEPPDQPAIDKPASEDDDELGDQLLKLPESDEDAKLKNLAISAQAQLIELRLHIRDSEKRDRLIPASVGPAVVKGSIQDLEALIRSVGAKNGIQISVEQHRSRYEKETFRVLKANVSLVQASLFITYSSLYTSVLNINAAFTGFLRGYPLFVDMNRQPLLTMIASIQGALDKQYVCVCSNGLSSARDPSEFLNQEKYLIFHSKLYVGLAQAHVSFERPRHLVSLSVFFATSMFVTIVFYFGLLVFLLPAYAYRTTLVNVLEKSGNQGKKNAISIAIALGAAPLAILLVIISRLL